MEAVALTFGTISLWFWALVVAEIVLLFIFTEYENGWAALVSFAVFCGALQWLGEVDLIKLVKSHPLVLGSLVISYLLIGLVWVIFKWRKLVKDQLRSYDEMYYKFLDDNRLSHDTTVLPDELLSQWERKIQNTNNYRTGRTIADVPLIRHNKARACKWFSLWPFSMSIYFLKDMMRELWNWIYARIAGFLQRMANDIWATRSDIPRNLRRTDQQN